VRHILLHISGSWPISVRFLHPIELLLRMSVVFYSSFVCLSAYANVYFKTILQECLRAGLPSGFPSTALPHVLVPAVLGTLAVWIPNQKKNPWAANSSVPFAGLFAGLKLAGKCLAESPAKEIYPQKSKLGLPNSSQLAQAILPGLIMIEMSLITPE